MAWVEEIDEIAQMGGLRAAWQDLLAETPGASFFQTPQWLELYWRCFGQDQTLRLLVVGEGDRPEGIVPLVVRREATRVGRLRVLTYPLDDWGSFYGPIGPKPVETLTAALEHVARRPRDWDMIELRWLDATEGDLSAAERAMQSAGLQGYPTVWNRTAVVELSDTWEAYFASRPRAWRRNFRHDEKRLAQQGELEYVRYRPRGAAQGEDDPRWDLYDQCEAIARQSWQGSAANGTTLSHASVREVFRQWHAAAAATGMVDLNLLRVGGQPVAFVYNYHDRGSLFGLRLGFDAAKSRGGAGTVLLGHVIRDSFVRGDRVFDLGVGSLECKRHFRTRVAEIFRLSHFHPAALRAQLIRAKRWAESRWRDPESIAAGRVQDGAADRR